MNPREPGYGWPQPGLLARSCRAHKSNTPLETKSKLDSKSTRKTKPVRIPYGCPHVQCVLLFNKAGVEDPRGVLEYIVSCDIVLEI
jgi:hypothetical protein